MMSLLGHGPALSTPPSWLRVGLLPWGGQSRAERVGEQG